MWVACVWPVHGLWATVRGGERLSSHRAVSPPIVALNCGNRDFGIPCSGPRRRVLPCPDRHGEGGRSPLTTVLGERATNSKRGAALAAATGVLHLVGGGRRSFSTECGRTCGRGGRRERIEPACIGPGPVDGVRERAPAQGVGGGMAVVVHRHRAHRARRARLRPRRAQRLGEGAHREPVPRRGPGRTRRCRRPRPRVGVRGASRRRAHARAARSPRRQRHTRSRGSGSAGTERRRRGHRRPTTGRQAEPEVHVRRLRDRLVEPVRPRRRPGSRRAAGPVVQPAVHLRRRRSRQDPPAPGRRPLRAGELSRLHGALRVVGDVPQRVRRRHPDEHQHRLPAPLPGGRPAPRRRHPVHRGQGGLPGGVLPHLQRALRGQPPDRAHLRPAARQHPDARGPAAQPVQDGPDHRHPAARPRDPAGHPAQEGRARPRGRRRPTCSSTSPPTSPTTSASSKAP